MRLIIAVALCLLASPAMADPVTGTIAAVSAWYASIGVVGQFAVQIGVSLALAAVSYGISYLMAGSGRASESAVEGPSVSIPERAGLLTRRRIYGVYTVSGAVVFQKTVKDSGSSQPDILVYGVAVSEGECEGLQSVIINGIECQLASDGSARTSPWWDGSLSYFKASFRSGADSQAIDPLLSARFTSPPDDFYPDLASGERATRWAEFRQRGVATVFVEMAFGRDADHHTELWGAGGAPNLQFMVKGLKVYDQSDPESDPADKSTWGWSDNAALIEQDWLNSDMGFAVPFDEMDTDLNGQSADFDKEYIPTLGGLERRGRINGEVFASERNTDVLGQMALQNRAVIGQAMGLVGVRSETAAAPVATIHAGLLAGDLTYQNEPDLRAAINRVSVEFHPASAFHESGEVSFEDASAQSVDGEILERRMALRFCDSSAAAQRLAFAALTENRAGRTLGVVLDIAALVAPGKANRMLEPGDCVRVEFGAPYAAVSGLYRVNAIGVNGDFTVSMQLSGTDANVIDGWSVDLEQAFA